ncbi:hypothetical protein D9M72_401830 [compost metagenome]
MPFPALEHGQHLAGEGFVQLDQVHLVQRQVQARQQLLHRGHRADAHVRGLAASRRPAHQRGHGGEAQFGQLVFGHDQAGGRGVVLLAGVAGGDGTVRHQRAQLAQAFTGGIRAEAFVAREPHRIALALGHLHGHDLGIEAAGLPGCRGACVAAGGEDIGLFAADGVVARQVLGRLDHPGDLAEALDRLGAFTAAVEAVEEAHIARARAPAHVGGVVLDIAHALDAARDHHVGGTALHHHRGRDDGLQAAAAAAVQLHARHLDRQAGLQRGPAADAGHFAVGVGLGKDHVVDTRGIDAAAFHHGANGGGGQFLHGHRAQAAAEGADGRAEGSDDCGSAHGSLLGNSVG